MKELASLSIEVKEGFQKMDNFIKSQKTAEELALNLPVNSDDEFEQFLELIADPKFYGAYVSTINFVTRERKFFHKFDFTL